MDISVNEKICITIAEASQLLSIGRDKMYQLANSEGFPVVRVGTKLIINRLKLLEWIDERTALNKPLF